MLRSEVNNAIERAKKLLKENKITLPFFAYMTKKDWEKSDIDRSVIEDVMLGWDITDFGSRNFEKVGATLFTVRNGSLYDKALGVPYAEKYIILHKDTKQEIPMHFHKMKTEDIINRAGGVLCIQVYGSLEDGGLDTESKVTVYCDGVKNEFEAGHIIRISTGNSVTLTPYVYHRFFCEESDTVIGEVSSVNDDNTDNIFLNAANRFSGIEEDEEITHLLVNEYCLLGGK